MHNFVSEYVGVIDLDIPSFLKKSLMYSLNNVSLNTKPWSIPTIRFSQSLQAEILLVLYFLSLTKIIIVLTPPRLEGDLKFSLISSARLDEAQ